MLKVYNTLSRKKEIFRPIKPPRVGIYTCGPTVYSYAHIGNFRSYIVADVIRRYLEYQGFKVKQVKNITDVGHLTEYDVARAQDKILLAAKREKKRPEEIAKFYTKAFFEDEKKLNIKRAEVYPRATKHIKEMQDLVKILIKKGYAYQISDGVYFQVPKFKNYGKLSGNTLDKLKKGVRIEPNPEKKHPADFALWKKASPEHLMQWPSPWSRGFPGWHLECSAMSMKYLGKSFDIHTGGEDNIFPHHEDEIAQSEAATGKKFVKYWIHIRHLLVEGEKMAKSKGNYYTLRDLENLGYSPLAFRLLVLSSHHQSKLNFTFRGIKQAEANLQRISEFITKLEELKNQKAKKQKFAKSLVLRTQKEFEKAMDNDFNAPTALASVLHLIGRGNYLLDKEKLTPVDARDILKILRKIDKVFGVIFWTPPSRRPVPKEISKLVKERERYRKKSQWKLADKIRRKIKKMGYWVEDTKKGPKIKKYERGNCF